MCARARLCLATTIRLAVCRSKANPSARRRAGRINQLDEYADSVLSGHLVNRECVIRLRSFVFALFGSGLLYIEIQMPWKLQLSCQDLLIDAEGIVVEERRVPAKTQINSAAGLKIKV